MESALYLTSFLYVLTKNLEPHLPELTALYLLRNTNITDSKFGTSSILCNAVNSSVPIPVNKNILVLFDIVEQYIKFRLTPKLLFEARREISNEKQ